MPDYSDIIERLEKATGPDRRLDFDLWSIVTNPSGFPAFSEPEPVRTNWFECWKDRNGFPNYTRSTDDARTLIPEGWEWTLHCETEDCRVEIGDPQIGLEGRSETPAIALCIAALKARAAPAGEGGKTERG